MTFCVEIAPKFGNHSRARWIVSTIQEWAKNQDLCYLGLDMGHEDDAIFLGQHTYFDAKLIPIEESKFARNGVVKETMCKQRIVLLLWSIQTRPDVNHRLRILAPSASEEVKWIPLL